MPRPGPRPYECVRRAWHSETHQPIRGFIIQHIFRLVHANHTVTTKKNKEWQEKLPILVLKSEEIMYSKANSQAEYSNPETVWDRLNDAIDTIIRKDDSAETGEFLPPCVEAALNLGCIPVRASRSQRHNNQRTYLRPAYQNSPKFPNENANQHNSVSMPLCTSNIDKRISSNTTEKPIDFLSDKLQVEHNTSFNRGSVYPLYYGTSFKSSHLGFQEHQKSDSIIVGVPIFSSVFESSEVGYIHNLFPCDGKEENVTTKGIYKGKDPEMGCDLSLRLGMDSVYRDGHQCCSYEKEISFFPNMDLASRKRKLPFDAHVEYNRFL